MTRVIHALIGAFFGAMTGIVLTDGFGFGNILLLMLVCAVVCALVAFIFGEKFFRILAIYLGADVRR